MWLYSDAPAKKRNSLRELLQWKLNTAILDDVENRDTILKVKNQSGAIDLFWLGHTMKYQHDLYRVMMDEGTNPVEAATIAFQRTLNPEWARP